MNPEGKINKAIKAVFLLILLGFVSCYTVLSILRESRQQSEVENRTLAQWKEPTFQSMANGTWEESTEQFLKDQFVFREDMFKGYYLFLDLQGMAERNGHVLGRRSAVLQIINEGDTGAAKEYGTDQVELMVRLQSIADQYGGRVIYLNTPHHKEIFDDCFPAGYSRWGKIHEIRRDSIISKAKNAGICVVETYDLMMLHKDEYIYYYTDNHWTQKGAYYAYKELLSKIGEYEGKEMDFPDWEEMEVTVRKDRMVGSYLRKLGDSGIFMTDHMEYAIPLDMPDYVRYDDGKLTKRKLINTSVNSHGAYMAGNIGNTRVETNRANLPSVLYIGYSYTNDLEAMSVYNFDRMESIDIRYWDGDIKEYLLESKPDYIVIVRDDFTLSNMRME